MLEHLFGSRTRVKLLTLFLHNPEEKFYVRELTRRIDTQINAVRREIDNLLKMGFIIEGAAEEPDVEAKRPGLRRKYYIVNKKFSLYHEIHSLMTKAHILLERKFDTQLDQLGKIYYLAFLGAFLGSTHQPVDLFLVGVISSDRAFKALIQELEKEVGFEINYTCMTPQDFAYRKEIADRFLNTILLAQKNVVIDRLDEIQTQIVRT